MKFQIVDAFTDTIFGGNPAGVVIIPEDREFPDDETMRKTAAELRYSETAFVKKTGEKRFQTRYFTPAAEVELCGHATIATFSTLRNIGMLKAGEVYLNDTLSGLLNIQIEEDSVLMDMAKPQNLGELGDEAAVNELYEVMGLSAEGQGVCQSNPDIYFQPMRVSTGLLDIMMPVKDEEELAAIAPDFPALTELSRRYEVTGVHAFTVNSKDGLIHARNFAPLYDIDEEAATGTSNGALTHYLDGYGLIEEGAINVVIQGEAMDRPSKISSLLTRQGDETLIQVGGPAVSLAAGEIQL